MNLTLIIFNFKMKMKKTNFFLTLLLFLVVFNVSASETQKTMTKSSLWHDLVTPNLEVSKAFYGNLLGWTFEDQNFKGFSYTLIKNNTETIGGMIEISSAKSSVWITSLIVSPKEMREKIKLALAAGCTLATKPLKIAGRGKQVIFESPQGEEFAFITETPASVDNNGDWIGMELWSDNPEKSATLYKDTFELTVSESLFDKKPYWVFKEQGNSVAGMVKNPIKNQKSQWVPYLKNTNPTQVISSVTNLGGFVILKPTENIRNGKLGIFQDPNGAILCIQSK
jgi:predicted enzyme related to lactoylglutathione lyase